MTDTCPKCGRPKAIDIDDAFLGQDTCSDGVPGVDDPSCREIEVASAYQRGRRDGIDEGVRIAKEHVVTDCQDCQWTQTGTHELGPYWFEVEVEAEKAKERTR